MFGTRVTLWWFCKTANHKASGSNPSEPITANVIHSRATDTRFVCQSFVCQSFVCQKSETNPGLHDQGKQARAGTGRHREARGKSMFNLPHPFFGSRQPCAAKFVPSQADSDSHDASVDKNTFVLNWNRNSLWKLPLGKDKLPLGTDPIGRIAEVG